MPWVGQPKKRSTTEPRLLPAAGALNQDLSRRIVNEPGPAIRHTQKVVIPPAIKAFRPQHTVHPDKKVQSQQRQEKNQSVSTVQPSEEAEQQKAANGISESKGELWKPLPDQ